MRFWTCGSYRLIVLKIQCATHPANVVVKIAVKGDNHLLMARMRSQEVPHDGMVALPGSRSEGLRRNVQEFGAVRGLDST